jgi:hypothetical protein
MEVSTLAALRETTPQEGNIDEKKWGAWGKGANEKWGEEESLKKNRKKRAAEAIE